GRAEDDAAGRSAIAEVRVCVLSQLPVVPASGVLAVAAPLGPRPCLRLTRHVAETFAGKRGRERRTGPLHGRQVVRRGAAQTIGQKRSAKLESGGSIDAEAVFAGTRLRYFDRYRHRVGTAQVI